MMYNGYKVILMAETRGRYTLKVIAPMSKRVYNIPFTFGELIDIPESKLKMVSSKYDGKVKLPLPLIDLFTINYDNSDELWDALYNLDNSLGIGNLKIGYQSKGNVNNLEVVYSDNNSIREFALKFLENSKIDINDYSLKRFALDACKLLNTERYLSRYLTEQHYLSGRVREAFSQYLSSYISGYDENDSFGFLLGTLNHYKTLRGLYIGINEYMNNKEEIIGNYEAEKECLKYIKKNLVEEKEKKTIVSEPSYEDVPLFELDENGNIVEDNGQMVLPGFEKRR